MKRVLARNSDLVGAMDDAQPSSEQYALFRAYLDARHSKGGMSEMTVLDYAMMVEDTHVNTKIIEYRRRGPDSFITGRGARRTHCGRVVRPNGRWPLHGVFVLQSRA